MADPDNSLSHLSLYLHIPFCTVKCSYCAFNVYTNLDRLIPAYVGALCREIALTGAGATKPVHTIYFGGGTPSLLTPQQIAQLLTACRESFDMLPDVEITLEANPENSDPAYFAALRKLGVNRLSIGMQSIQPDELRLYARQHGPQATADAVRAGRKAGFNNISLDLIYGAPNQELDSWVQTVKAALTLEPDHLSLYAMQLEPGTPLAGWVEGGRLPRPDDDLAADMYELADEKLSAAGFEQYEISSFARPGKQCQHNRQYWTHGDYLGLGAGAHGFVHTHSGGLRYTVVRGPSVYIDRVNGQTETASYPLSAAQQDMEPIDRAQMMDEMLITGLRLLREGVCRTDFEKRFGISLDSVYGDVVPRLVGLELLHDDGETLRLTRRARLIANQALVYFMREHA